MECFEGGSGAYVLAQRARQGKSDALAPFQAASLVKNEERPALTLHLNVNFAVVNTLG